MNMVRLSACAALLGVAFSFPSFVSANHSPSEGEGEYAESTEAHEEHEEGEHDESSSVAQGATHHTAVALGLGSTGPAVTALQAELIAKGLLALASPTGYYGPLTAQAVEKQSAMSAHSHAPIDISDWAKKPRVSAKLHEDALGGYNLEVHAANYRFAPQHVNGPVRKNEGHAHIYVNGVKVARLYGSWFNLPASLFHKGENEVRVTLNANDHSELENDGDIVEDRMVVTVNH